VENTAHKLAARFKGMQLRKHRLDQNLSFELLSAVLKASRPEINALEEGNLGFFAARGVDLRLLQDRYESAMLVGALQYRSARTPKAQSPVNGATQGAHDPRQPRERKAFVPPYLRDNPTK